MRLVCGPSDFNFNSLPSDLGVVLFGNARTHKQGSAGEAVFKEIQRQKLVPDHRSWDLLAIALSVIVADLAGHRKQSPDGWTREFELTIAVQDRLFWKAQTAKLQNLFSFLTTDRWKLRFVDGGLVPESSPKPEFPDADCVSLLSGGLDSLIGNIDLVEQGITPFTVTQTVRGDGQKQKAFADKIGGGLRQFKVNHNARVPDPETPSSQRARSIIFLAYGVLIATSLKRYHAGQEVVLYVCENGFISINPPLTGGRVGSLSTRTTHPVVFSLLQEILNAAGIRVKILNPYRLKTKGEMLIECKNQRLLKELADQTTSCGRFLVFGHKHCGRCVPCMVRRASFQKWGGKDRTEYVHANLGINNDENAGFDDVRSALIAVYERQEHRTKRWLSSALSSPRIADKSGLVQMIERGVKEIEGFLNSHGVK